MTQHDRYARYRQFRTVLAERIGAALSAHERDPTAEIELEIRFGHLQRSGPPPPSTVAEALLPVGDRRTRFEPGIEPWLFLALFDHMAKRGDTVLSDPSIDVVERGAHQQRVIHTSLEHTACRRERKTRLSADNFERCGELQALCDVRIALSAEQTLDSDACSAHRSRPLPDNAPVRFRREVAMQRGDDVWRFDFTELDDGAALQLELELRVGRAVQRVQPQYRAAQRHARADISFREFFVHVVGERLLCLLDWLEATVDQLRVTHAERAMAMGTQRLIGAQRKTRTALQRLAQHGLTPIAN
jgi:hypothetical protein